MDYKELPKHLDGLVLEDDDMETDPDIDPNNIITSGNISTHDKYDTGAGRVDARHLVTVLMDMKIILKDNFDKTVSIFKAKRPDVY